MTDLLIDLGIAPTHRIRFPTVTAAVLLALLIGLAWGQALAAWFGPDDFAWLDLSTLPDVLHSFAGPFGLGNAFRPIYRVMLLIDSVLFGENATGWHAANLVLHFLCSMALFRLVLQLWGSWNLAIITAAIFVTMPVLSDNVVWIAGCTNSVSTLFALVAISAFNRAIATRSKWAAIVAAFAAVLGTAAYEPAIVSVIIMLLIIAARWRSSDRRFLVGAWMAVLLLQAALLAWRHAVLGPSGFYAARSLALPSLMQDLRDAFSCFQQMLNGPGWVVLIGLPLLLSRRYRSLRLVFVAGVAVSLLALAPYAPFTGVGIRYFYFSGMGVALSVGACVSALADFLGGSLQRWWRDRARLAKPLLTAMIVLALVGNNIAGAREITAEWVMAGRLSRTILANVRDAVPQADGQTLLVLMDLPILYGRAGMFFTHAEKGFRRFAGTQDEFILPGHYLQFQPAWFSVGLVKAAIGEEDERRNRRGLERLACFDEIAVTMQTIDEFVARLPNCRVLFLQISAQGDVAQRSYGDFVSWYQQQTARLPLQAPAPPVVNQAGAGR